MSRDVEGIAAQKIAIKKNCRVFKSQSAKSQVFLQKSHKNRRQKSLRFFCERRKNRSVSTFSKSQCFCEQINPTQIHSKIQISIWEFCCQNPHWKNLALTNFCSFWACPTEMEEHASTIQIWDILSFLDILSSNEKNHEALLLDASGVSGGDQLWLNIS